MEDELTIAGRAFRSRLILGTGKYDTFERMRDAVTASGAEMVTVAVRRIDFDAPAEDIAAFLPDEILLLPNTAGAETAAEAVRMARLARAGGLPDWIKLEVIAEPRYLMPDPVETLKAAETLLAVFASAIQAGEAVGRAIRLGARPRALELLDRATIEHLRGRTPYRLPENAGAVLLPDSLERTVKLGLDANGLLASNDSYSFFSGIGDLVVTGPTRTNVNDYRAILLT